jgi:L-alanine-DL-glutamate epimerase-like enolase superfamily enzyme
MQLRYYPYRLQFKRVFRIAAGARTGTDVVYVELEQDGQIGYGEAALPPYLPETVETVTQYLASVALPNSILDASLRDIITALPPNNHAAKAALDIALHDLHGKLTGQTAAQMLDITHPHDCLSTFTLGISDRETMQAALEDSAPFRLIKLKLDGINDRQLVTDLLSLTNRPFCVDVNQGWTDLAYAQEMSHWLHEKGCFLIEQPTPKADLDLMARLTEQSPIPIIADEAVWTMPDLDKVKKACHGINIKLMKTGGLLEAKQMIDQARKFDMKILVGCMSESSCGVTAASHLAGLCDWADLDGPYLIANDPFTGMKIEDGKVKTPKGIGLGVIKK